uniref:Uncharacterized protein n=1 Tax=Arundo donax TaxID=35708 RepID=A0A0A9ALV6_ARUDO
MRRSAMVSCHPLTLV